MKRQMQWIVGWVVIWGLAGELLASGSGLIPNPLFDRGKDRLPVGWTPSSKTCRWITTQVPEGTHAIEVVGDGQSSTSWTSEPIPLTPNGVYELRFWVAGHYSGGTPVSGPLFCNRDLGRGIGPDWQQVRSIFVAPSRVTPSDSRIRFGQWKIKGTVRFAAVSLHQVIPIHARSHGVELGEGEMLIDRRYWCRAPLGGSYGNYSRALLSHRCRLNTDRWVFGPGDEVIYVHRIAFHPQKKARLNVSISWYESGELWVEASTNRQQWILIGKLGQKGAIAKALPQKLFPAHTVYVRLRAVADPQRKTASFQVRSYFYEAEVLGEPMRLAGFTVFAVLKNPEPDLILRPIALSPPQQGTNNVLFLSLQRRQGTEVLRPVSRILGQEARWERRVPPVKVTPQRQTLAIPFALPDVGDWTVEIALGNEADTRIQIPVRVPRYRRTDYGKRLPASTPDVILWTASSGWKIPPDRPAPTKTTSALSIRLARNETEAVQLVVRPNRPLRHFFIQPLGPARGPDGATLPSTVLEILRVRYVFIQQPTDSLGTPGLWPDPLPPLRSPMTLQPHRNYPFWIRVHTPHGIPAGDYTATLQLTASGWQAQVPLHIHVYDFTLPDRMTCSTAFGFSTANVWRYQNLKTEEQRRHVLNLYLDDFAAHHISPYNPTPMDPFVVHWPKVTPQNRNTLRPEELVPTIDWTAWDRAMEVAIHRRHFNSFRLPPVGMGGGTFHSRRPPSLLGYSEDTPHYRAAFRAYWRMVQDHLEQKGWLDEAYVYWFDEPAPKDYAFVMNGFRKLKEAAPKIRRMLTEQVEPELIGGPNLWCPLTANFDPQAAAERRKYGEQFWWYICTGPKAPYCGLFIDHPGPELRVWLWQTWKYQLDGILIWQTTYWTSSAAYPDPQHPQNPYEDPMSWTSDYGTPKGVKRPWGNGDGRFLYPPEEAADAHPAHPVLSGPVDSIRWEMLRDGIEDYEYFALLRRLLREKANRLSPSERKRFEALLQVPPEIVRSMTEFTDDPRQIEAQRDRLAHAIERLRKR